MGIDTGADLEVLVSSPQDFEVSYDARDFGTVIPRRGQISFSADDLAHALFATGRAPADESRHGDASVWEWVHRTSLIPAYVRRRRPRKLIRSALALELDRSEKVGLSYALGQAMTAIFSDKLLSVPYLMHVDRYAKRYKLQYAATRKRADLFGLAPAGWVVAEAKGRSGTMSSDLEDKLKEQKRSIRTIDGQVPWLAYGAVASFPTTGTGTDHLRLDAFDPVENETEAIDLDVDLDSFILAYYEPFLAAIAFGDQQEDPSLLIATLGPLRIRVGILKDIADRVRRASEGELENLHRDVTRILDNAEARRAVQFRDGTVVSTGWSEVLNLADWQEY